MILRKIEYSQIVRRKMKELKSDLTDKYGENGILYVGIEQFLLDESAMDL